MAMTVEDYLLGQSCNYQRRVVTREARITNGTLLLPETLAEAKEYKKEITVLSLAKI